MDTWTADNSKMWLRDFLPTSTHLEKSRIMTFGYDSNLADRRSTMMLEDWAENLLQSVSDARTSDRASLLKKVVSLLLSTNRCPGEV